MFQLWYVLCSFLGRARGVYDMLVQATPREVSAVIYTHK